MSTTKELDYFTIASKAKTLNTSGCKKTIRVALLSDCSVQHLAPILNVLSAEREVQLNLYQGGYDQIDIEILDSTSGLYLFNPQFIIILLSTEKLKSRYYDTTQKSDFADSIVKRYVNLWAILKTKSDAVIVQCNYVLPLERAFGNYESKVDNSLGSSIIKINNRLTEESRHASNVLLCDVDYIAAGKGRFNWFDFRLWNLAKAPCKLDYMPHLAKGLLDVIFAASGQFVKCIILDLDNTLWGGVIGDDGVNGIALGDFDEGEAFVAFQYFLKELKSRGIILAVVSKNEQAAALLPFRQHPKMVLKEEDISVFIANWENKADNIQKIQKILNIGFDSMVFLDDNPYERNLVRTFIPELIVPELPQDPSLYVASLAELNLFETATCSQADALRTDQYREEAKRVQAQQDFTNIEGYLTSLEMSITLQRFNPFNLPRIAQLIQRSNQFNLCTQRYSEAVCQRLMENVDDGFPFSISLKDRFGDYGLISVVVLKYGDKSVIIDEYLMSCRVLQRGVEQYVMNNIFSLAQKRGVRSVLGAYIKTSKNEMVKDFYSSFGFKKVADRDAKSDWALNVNGYTKMHHVIATVVNEIDDL